jgi:oligogalacturonide transporter
MNEKKLTMGRKFGYATGDVLGGGAFTLLSLLFLHYLITIEGISPGLAGTVVLIGKIWDAVSDPMMGILSDRTKSKLGRRRIYFLVGTIPVIVSFSLLWYSFGIQSMGAKFVYYIVVYIMFSTFFTLVMVPYNALLPDMVIGYKERAGFSTIRMFVSSMAALLSATVPNMLLGDENTRTVKDYLFMGIVFGCFYGFPLLITTFTTWELEDAKGFKQCCFKEQVINLRDSFKNLAYRQYLGIFVCGQMATDVCTTLIAFWLVDVLERNGMVTIVSGITMIVAVALLPLNNWVAKKYGKQLPGVFNQPFRIIGLAIAFFMGAKSGLFFIVFVSVLNGIGGSASSFVPWTLLPDLPDSDEMITGKRNSGTYAGTSTFVRKFTSGFAIFAVSLVMEGFGYVESTANVVVEQTPNAILGIRIIFSVIPMILTVLTIWLCTKYTLTKENHKLIMEAITCKKETGLPITDEKVRKACEVVTGQKFETMWVGNTLAE